MFNPGSALHNEDDGFFSGFLGYTKPVTKAVYGNFEFVEALAANGGSPLDLEFDLRRSMGPDQLEASQSTFLRVYADAWSIRVEYYGCISLKGS